MAFFNEELVQVFEDTQRFYTENPILADAVEASRRNTKLYEADDYPPLPANPIQRNDSTQHNDPTQHNATTQPRASTQRKHEVRVTKHKTFEAAMALHKEFPDKKIAVLNFASAMRPGGGVKKGARAQEESLCRCSTLFPTIDRRWLWNEYYDVNRAAKDVRHSDACIYSPGVIICKTDESIPKRMPESEFVTVDVISCAAPDLKKKPYNRYNPETGRAINVDNQELYVIHLKRARHILHIAAANRVDILVLGAFGCGAFHNDPEVVAEACKDAILDDQYKDKFDLIEFAIYCKATETRNYEAFNRRIGN